ncbi:MAG: hypothetical protein ABA06_02945 [Parcubacteria bacterium C7867-001]|nr:MAG: hypothetical protein ABA06_02945 [Parcubacteria bacterium C7867-001]
MISIKEAISFGWKTFKARPWFFVLVPFVVMLAAFAIGIVQGIVVAMLGKTIGPVVSFVISAALNIFIGMGVISLYLKAHDSVSSVKLKDLWNPKPFWKYLGVNVLAVIIVLIGFILLIIPGIIASLAIMFAQYLVVDKGLNPIAAVKESARLTKGKRWKLLGFLLAIVGVNLLGLIALGIGMFVSVPVSIFAVVHMYRSLVGGTASAPAPAPVAA